MSKAYQCDNCQECFPGAPAKELGDGKELCHRCLRGFQAFASMDPFIKSAKASAPQPAGHGHCGCGHHHHH
jgi:hypothetical protein